eukprot:TRINITY_DN238_c0_g1_i2.p1 TRINITY_DN238_c0_g1~~TRINITY_DN238_c0_g1_i2.p1  ORF type:complete len:830 (+),score=159.43 TRINITY_DN238_c0_g1_i2:325-2814(+)
MAGTEAKKKDTRAPSTSKNDGRSAQPPSSASGVGSAKKAGSKSDLPKEAAILDKLRNEIEVQLPDWKGKSRLLVTMTSDYGKKLSESKGALTTTSEGKKVFNGHARYLRSLKGDLETIIIKDAASTLVEEAKEVIDSAETIYRQGKKKKALDIMTGDGLGNKLAPLAVDKFAELDNVSELQKRIKRVTKLMKAGKELPEPKKKGEKKGKEDGDGKTELDKEDKGNKKTKDEEEKTNEKRDEQDRAATKIQAVYRGNRGRAETERRLVEKAHQDVAATKIQSVYRGQRARRDTEAMRAKGPNRTQLKPLDEDVAATKIQSVYRGQRARRDTEAMRTKANKPGKPGSTTTPSTKESKPSEKLTQREIERQQRIERMQKNLASLENEARMRKRLAELKAEEEQQQSGPTETDKVTAPEQVTEDASWRRYAVRHREATGRPVDGGTPNATELESELLQLRHALHGRDMEIAHLRRSLAIPTHQVSEMRKALVKLNNEVAHLKGKRGGPAGPLPQHNPFRRDSKGQATDLTPGSPLAAAWETYYEKKSARTRDRHGHRRGSLDNQTRASPRVTPRDMHVPGDVARNLTFKYAPLNNPVPDPIDALPTPRYIAQGMQARAQTQPKKRGQESRSWRRGQSHLEEIEEVIAANESFMNTVISELESALSRTESHNPINPPTPSHQFRYRPLTPSAVDSLTRVTLGSSRKILKSKNEVRKHFPSPQQQRANARRARTAASKRQQAKQDDQTLPVINQRARTAVPPESADTAPWTPQANAMVARNQSVRRAQRSAVPKDALRGEPSLLARDRLGISHQRILTTPLRAPSLGLKPCPFTI